MKRKYHYQIEKESFAYHKTEHRLELASLSAFELVSHSMKNSHSQETNA